MSEENITLSFCFYGQEIKVQCLKDNTMELVFQKFCEKAKTDIKSVYFLCNGNMVNNYNKKVGEMLNGHNTLKLIVQDIENDDDIINAQEKIFPKEILCPECDEEKSCIINISDYKITLNKCDNNHNSEKILLKKYLEKAKNVDNSKIKCENCETTKSKVYNNYFYKCLDCKKNICPLCKTKHDKKHTIINYDLKNYLCDKHNLNVVNYCNKCHKNLCFICSCEDDETHELENLVELYRKNKVINNLHALRKAIDDYKNIEKSNDVKFDASQKTAFEKTVNNLETYYKISENILNNFDLNLTNYQKINNRINIYKANLLIIEDLDKIIKETKVDDKINKIMNLEDKMNTI